MTFTLCQEDVPEVIRKAALREGKPLGEFVKDGLLMVAARIDGATAPVDPPKKDSRKRRAA